MPVEILPSPEDLRITPSTASQNAIEHVNIVIYGRPRRSKTELANSIVGTVSRFYRGDVTHVGYRVTDLTDALENGWGKGSVQQLVIDDLTLAEHPPETYQRFFRIGHVMEEKTDLRNGLVVTVLVVHRFYALPKELRADIDLLAVTSIPKNPSDLSLIKSFLGEEITNRLSESSRRRDVFAYYVRPDYRVMTAFTPEEENYLGTNRAAKTEEKSNEEVSLNPSEERIIRDIASGRDTVNGLLTELGWSRGSIQSEVDRMIDNGFLAREGFRKRLRITPKAYNQVPQMETRRTPNEKPKAKTTKFDVSWLLGFKLVFGALLGLFFGWLLISGLSGLIYWAAWTFFLKQYVPASILPWVPLQNPLADFMLGIISGTWFFLKINPTQFFTALPKGRG